MANDLDSALREAVRDELRVILARLDQLGAALAQRDRGDGDQMLTIREVAQLIGRSEAGLRRSVERGSFALKPVRIGRLLRFKRGDIEALANGGGR